MRKVELARLAFSEVAEIDMQSAVLLLPMGVLEQHGPGIPMGTDYVFAERVAIETARRLDNVYVAPTINYGYSPTFQNFPGNLGLPYDIFTAHLRAVLERLVACGWRHIVYVNSHAGNEPACEQVAREMRERYGLTMAHLFPYRMAGEFCRDLYDDPKSTYGHGGSSTGSVAMALFGSDVRLDRLEKGRPRGPLPGFEASTAKSVTFKGFTVGLYVDTEMLTANGVSGDPRDTSRERGEETIRRIVNYCVEFLPVYRELVTRHLHERGHYHE